MNRTHRSRNGVSRLGKSAVVLLALVLVAPPVLADDLDLYRLADLKALQRAFIKLADEARPSVVSITSFKMRRSRRGRPSRPRIDSHGSGLIIDSTGYILTNRHVIEGASNVEITLHNGMKYEADVVQNDKRSDLAVLKIDEEHLKAVRWGDLADVRVNQWAFAVGNPFGLARSTGRSSVTYGVVSALDRDLSSRLARGSNSDEKYYGNLIETSAAINPGSSGGPLFNIDGEVIGVVTAIETSSGVNEGHGFAIPIDENTRRLIDTLKAGEDFRYGFMGVDLEIYREGRRPRFVRSFRPRGATIREIIIPQGPAGRAGLLAGDMIVEYNGVSIRNSDHLIRLVGFTPVGTTVTVTYERKGAKRETQLTVGDREDLLRDDDSTDK